MLGALGMASSAIGCPSDDYLINQSIVFNWTFCNINDSNNNGALIINSDDILLDCNGTVFNGTYTALATGLFGDLFDNITVINCTFQNFYHGIALSHMQDVVIANNNVSNNLYSGIGVADSNNVLIENNTLERNMLGMYLVRNTGSSVVDNNTLFNNNTFGITFTDISGAIVNDNSASNSYMYDIFTANSTITLTNTVYESLITGWNLRVYVSDVNGSSVGDYRTETFDVNGRNIYNMSTNFPYVDLNGLVEYIENSSGIFNYTPHTVNISKVGYDTNSTTVIMIGTKSINLTIKQTPPPAADTTPPVISLSLSPSSVLNGSQVNLHVDAMDNVNVSTIWAIIDYPGSGQDTIFLNNHTDNFYNVTRLGRHNVTIYANDSSDNRANVTDNFMSVVGITINISVYENDGDGTDSVVTIFDKATHSVIDSFSSASGDFPNKAVANGTYDLQFNAYDDEFVVLLLDVDLWDNIDRQIGMDDPNPPTGYELTYAAETDYAFGKAIVRVYYDEGDIGDEDGLMLYICDDWNFSARLCNTTWSNHTNATHNKSADYFEIGVTSFSAFSLRQDSYCGDGVCDSSENATSCSTDCVCNTGDTRLCSLNNKGECGAGSETCSNGIWSGCPSPGTETCNNLDDDCDGNIDDIASGTSVETTKCGCYNGTSPTTEVFDGIDNDCNGQIDDGCVCNESETDTCGSNIGECSQGTKTCVNCVWGECTGETGPFEEVCGNGLDDDCDGVIDEPQPNCIVSNNVTCGYGVIPTSGCKCGNGTYANGFCCDGAFQWESCPDFPYWILIIIGAALLAGILVYYFLVLKKKGRGKKDAWEALEKKYTPAKI
jgi:parallel beta-helix repeat protein